VKYLYAPDFDPIIGTYTPFKPGEILADLEVTIVITKDGKDYTFTGHVEDNGEIVLEGLLPVELAGTGHDIRLVFTDKTNGAIRARVKDKISIFARLEWIVTLPRVIYVDRPNQMVGRYTPEYPFYEDNWLERDSTLIVSALTNMPVYLLLNPDGFSATAFIEGKLSPSYAREVDYPVTLEVYVTKPQEVHFNTSQVRVWFCNAPTIDINDAFKPGPNGEIGTMTLPKTYPYEGDSIPKGGKLDIMIDVYDDEGNLVGSYPGIINDNYEIIPDPEFWPEFDPGDYTVDIRTADEWGHERIIGSDDVTVPPAGTIDIADETTTTGPSIIGWYEPSDNLEDNGYVVVVIIGGEEFEGKVEDDGTITIPGGLPDDLVGEQDITITVYPSDYPAGNPDPLAGPETGTITIVPNATSDSLLITDIRVVTKAGVEWIEIDVVGCVNWKKSYTLYGHSENISKDAARNREISAKDVLDANGVLLTRGSPIRQSPVRGVVEGEIRAGNPRAGFLTFEFVKPNTDAHFFHAVEIETLSTY
jgi:hypothetical protein